MDNIIHSPAHTSDDKLTINSVSKTIYKRETDLLLSCLSIGRLQRQVYLTIGWVLYSIGIGCMSVQQDNDR